MNRSGYALLVSLALPFGSAQCDPRNWIDHYIAAHGHCMQQPTGPYSTTNPLEKPIEEWTDDDLNKLKAALDRCDALPESQTAISRQWTGQFYERLASLVHEQQARTAQQEEAQSYARDRAEQAEATRARKAEAAKRAATARLDALKRATEQEAMDKKSSEEREAGIAEEQKEASRLADETEARAKAALALRAGPSGTWPDGRRHFRDMSRLAEDAWALV